MARVGVLASLGASIAMAFINCGYGPPPYVPPPQTTAEDLYANPRQCGWEEWRAYEERRKAEQPTEKSLTRTSKLVALGREVALIGNGKLQLLGVDSKSIRHVDIPDWVVDAVRGDGRIWLVTKPLGDGNRSARVWSYSKRTLELVSELPIASCKTIVALGAAGDTLIVVSDRWLASSRDARSWKLTTLARPANPGFSSFVCLDATHCVLGVAAPGLVAGDLLAMNPATGQTGLPRSVAKAPGLLCSSHVNGVIADPVNASCALLAMGAIGHRGGREDGCVLRVCGDSASLVFARSKQETARGSVAMEAVWQVAAQGARVFASTSRGVYEFVEGKQSALPLRFEALGDIWASFAAPGLVVITTSAPNADDRYGTRKLVVGIDPN
jgi:hypothetical protein